MFIGLSHYSDVTLPNSNLPPNIMKCGDFVNLKPEIHDFIRFPQPKPRIGPGKDRLLKVKDHAE